MFSLAGVVPRGCVVVKVALAAHYTKINASVSDDGAAQVR